MTTLLLAEHDNKSLKDSTNKAQTAVKALGGDVDVLVAGLGCKAVAEAAAKLDGVNKVLLADAANYEHGLAEPLAALVVSLAGGYDAISAPATTNGKNVMPRVAALLDVMAAPSVVASDATVTAPCVRPVTLSGQEFLELVQRYAPALLVAVARILVEELLVRQRQQRSTAVGLQQHRDQRFTLRRALPRPGEDDFFVRHHFAIDAADVMLVAGRDHLDVIAAANAQIGFRAHADNLLGPHPAR